MQSLGRHHAQVDDCHLRMTALVVPGFLATSAKFEFRVDQSLAKKASADSYGPEGAYFSDRGRLFQADRGRQNGVAAAALGKRTGTGLNVAQSSTISLKCRPRWAEIRTRASVHRRDHTARNPAVHKGSPCR